MSEIPTGSDLARLLAFLDGAGYQRRHASSPAAAEPDGLTVTERLTTGFACKDAGLVEENPGRRCYDLTEGDQTSSPASGPGVTEAFVYHWEVSVPEGIGYCAFYCDFYFAADGALLGHGVWE